MVEYSVNGPFVLRYTCHRSRLDNGERPCISFAGLAVDDAISSELLTVLQPAAIEAAVLASEEQRHQQDEILSVLEKELEGAWYAAHRAEKQFDSAEPDNRLVASELERRWNQAMQMVREAEMRIEQQRQRQRVEAVKPEEFEVSPRISKPCGITPLATGSSSGVSCGRWLRRLWSI